MTLDGKELLKNIVSDVLELGRKHSDRVIDETIGVEHSTLAGIIKGVVKTLHDAGRHELNERPTLEGHSIALKSLPSTESSQTISAEIKEVKVESKEKSKEDIF